MKIQPKKMFAQPFTLISRFFASSQRRFRLSRPGSVLILCIALLVLLALIGTAMISTAGVDRYASVQHTYNTQIDLLVEGVKSMAQSWIEGRSEGGLTQDATKNVPLALFRPADQDVDQGQQKSDALKYDSITTVDCSGITTSGVQDMWLAPRLPQLTVAQYTNGTLQPSASTANPPIWQALTMPLAPQVAGGAPIYEFESPYNSLATTQSPVPVVTAVRKTDNIGYITTASGTVFPALHIPGAGTFMAADTDGDGIPDALYFKLTKVGDITYYAATRIIDNNSAINANTAWSRDYDFANASAGGFRRDSTQTGATAGALNYGFFRSNVGFMEMFPDYKAGAGATNPGASVQMNGTVGSANSTQSINRYRFNNLDAAADNAVVPSVYYWNTVTKAVVPRHDFQYATQGDGLEFGLASRLDNPGYNFFTPDNGVISPDPTPFRAFSTSDTAALVSRFAILNPSASASELESDGTIGLMSRRIGTTDVAISSTPYQPNGTSDQNDSIRWYNDNFNFDLQPSTGVPTPYVRMPLRSILVTRNPVSNLAPVPHAPYDYNQDLAGSTQFNSNANYTAAGGDDPLTSPYLTPAWGYSPTLVANAPTGMAPYYTSGNGTLTTAVNAKTNINTAPFPELWRAFWSVMADVKLAAGAAPDNQRVGANPPHYGVDGGIFRSPSRDPRTSPTIDPLLTVQFKPTPSQMLQIRSALAAVNAIDLRDGDDDITSREVPIFEFNGAGPPAAPKFRVRVFGNERQPFITKVYYNGYTDDLGTGDVPTGAAQGSGPWGDSNLVAGKNTKNPKGYIAVELYNPYPVPMQLNRWAIGVVNRTAVSYTQPGALSGSLHIQRLSTRSISPPAGFDQAYLNQIDRVTGQINNGLAYPNVIIPANGYAVLENFMPSKGTPAGFTADTTSDANYRPPRILNLFNKSGDSTGNPLSTIAFVYVPNLTDVIQPATGSPNGGEMVLLRPHRADGTLTATVDPSGKLIDPSEANNQYHEIVNNTAGGPPNLADFVPIDSYDFTGLTIVSAPAPLYPSWFYHRPDNPLTNAWQFVYPGTYDVTKGGNAASPRQEGTSGPPDYQFAQLTDESNPPIFFGQPNDSNAPFYVNNFPGIQLQNVDWGKNSPYNRWPALAAGSKVSPVGFPALPIKTAPYQYPFGGFARNGDMMMVPFIGAYQVLPPTFADNSYTAEQANSAATLTNETPFYEFTPITMDCSFADDCQRNPLGTSSSSATRAADPAGSGDDADEQVGRFCPIQDAAVQDLNFVLQDTAADSPYANPTSNIGGYHWKYHFATRLFDYLTVQGPSDDYLPMTDPNASDITAAAASPSGPSNTTELNKYPYGSGATDNANAIKPLAVPNSLNPSTAWDHTITTNPTGTENRLGVDGLININTAPWYVLAQLPLLPPSAAGAPVNADGIPPNIEALAKEIVNYRETVGPYRSIFDLNAIFTSANYMPKDSRTGNPIVQSSTATPEPATDVAAGTDWDISPNGTQAANDFEKKYLLLTRISNLITTRSDTFTVFITVDGFRNAGTNDPQLVVHRRAAMIVDRSQLTNEQGSTSSRINVPTQ